MTTTAASELELFQRFIESQLKNQDRIPSPEESLTEFRAYQKELEKCRKELQPSIARSLRGEGQEFDAEDLKRQIGLDTSAKGVSD
ncbi:MAG: hypothetical protein IID45_02495 [Planctomycetes bacterium]|nr:hypothetical protein [Planctomycetota bacterium]